MLQHYQKASTWRLCSTLIHTITPSNPPVPKLLDARIWPNAWPLANSNFCWPNVLAFFLMVVVGPLGEAAGLR